jgi:hypothetical protein
VLVIAGIVFWPSGVFSRHFTISSTKHNALYDEVASELQANTMVPGLWAKAFAEARGQIDQARALYIRYRVAQLAQEASEQARQRRQAATEAAKQRAISRFRRPAYTLLSVVFGLLIPIFALVGAGDFIYACSDAPLNSMTSWVVWSVVFASLAALCACLMYMCIRALKSTPPPPPPAMDHRIGN